MNAFSVGQSVLFTAPQNVNTTEHGIGPGQRVRSVIAEVEECGDKYVAVFDGGRVAALESELEAI